jgi:hypothetical protein
VLLNRVYGLPDDDQGLRPGTPFLEGDREKFAGFWVIPLDRRGMGLLVFIRTRSDTRAGRYFIVRIREWYRP